MGDAYKVQNLKKMLAHETSKTEVHYGAKLAHWYGDTNTLTIDAGGLRTIRSTAQIWEMRARAMDDNVLECPYCGQEQHTHEPDDVTAYMCYTECEHCSRRFIYAVTVARHYESFKDDEQEDGR